MSLTDRDLEQVGTYVRAHLIEWLPEPVLDLNARIVRVEEELRSQRDLTNRRCDQIDKRLDQIDRRLEQVDKRLDEQSNEWRTRLDEHRAEWTERLDRQSDEWRAQLSEHRAEWRATLNEQRAEWNARFDEQKTLWTARFDDAHAHTNRWMTIISLILGLMTVAMTVTNLM